jgi:hypothetical protein
VSFASATGTLTGTFNGAGSRHAGNPTPWSVKRWSMRSRCSRFGLIRELIRSAVLYYTRSIDESRTRP